MQTIQRKKPGKKKILGDGCVMVGWNALKKKPQVLLIPLKNKPTHSTDGNVHNKGRLGSWHKVVLAGVQLS